MPDWSVFPKGKHISVSQAKLCHQCMFAWKCRYIDKIVKPKSRIMEMGILYDEYCNGKFFITDPVEAIPGYGSLGLVECAIVWDRWNRYRSRIHPDDLHQVPVWMPIEGTEYHVIGWVDRIEMKDGKHDILVDHKFAEKPWSEWKYDANKIQAQTYLACMQHMGYKVNKFRFDVVNTQTVEIQQFPPNKPYSPQKKTLAVTVPNYYRQAIEWIETGYREPEFNELCGWCDYQRECEQYLSKGEKQHEITNRTDPVPQA